MRANGEFQRADAGSEVVEALWTGAHRGVPDSVPTLGLKPYETILRNKPRNREIRPGFTTQYNTIRYGVNPLILATNQEVASSSLAGRTNSFRFIRELAGLSCRSAPSELVSPPPFRRGRPRGRAFAWQNAWHSVTF